MGFNTTIVLSNDQLQVIKNNSKIGEQIYNAVLSFSNSDPESGTVANGSMKVVASHHSGTYITVLVGGHSGKIVKGICIPLSTEEPEVLLLKELADRLGYRVSKKNAKLK